MGGTSTILFTDFVGSTETLERLGDDAADELRRRSFAVLREAASRHGGREVKSLGDGLMFSFDGAVAGVGCAAEMQQALQYLNRTGPFPEIGMRVGINAGDAIEDEGDLYGAPVVVASRLCDRAEAGQVIVSDVVAKLVGRRGGARFRDLGPLELKGLAEPVRARELLLDEAAPGQAPPGLRAAGAEPGDAATEVVPLPTPTALAEVGSGLMAGRVESLERLIELLPARDSEAGAAVMVVGDPGIGKSRLAAAVAARAADAGVSVLYGRCEEETLIPYQPFVEALRHWVNHTDAESIRNHVREAGPELARLTPELGRRVPGLEAAARAGGDTERYLLFESAASLLRALAAEHPLLLVLDDLHWGDQPTLLLLRHLIRALRNSPILILGSYRKTELRDEHPLATALADLRRDDLSETLALGGLEQADVGQLVGAWLGDEAPAALADRIWRETEGNPLFVREVLRHLDEVGAREAVVDSPGDLSVERLGIPEGVRAVIAGRLARLPEHCNLVLRAAAVAGTQFRLDVIERVAGLELEILLDAVEETVAAGLVIEHPGKPGRFGFSHSLIRETLSTGLSGARRAILHHRIGEALEQLHPPGTTRPLGALAYHFVAAGDSERGLAYSIEAGDAAHHSLAYEDAARHYRRALELLGDDPAEAERRCGLQLSLGEALRRAGELEPAREIFLAAAAGARHLGRGEELARAALGHGAGAGGMGFLDGPDETLIELLEEALQMLDGAENALRVRVLARLALELYFTDQAGRREQLGAEAVDLAERLGDRQALTVALYGSARATWGPDNAAERNQASARIIELAVELSNIEMEFLGRHLRFCVSLELGEMDRFDAEVDHCERLADALREPLYRWQAGVMRANQVLTRGDIARGGQLAQKAFEIGSGGQQENALAFLAPHLFIQYWGEGRLGELEEGTRAYADQYQWVQGWRAALAFLYSEIGRLDEARAELEALAPNRFVAVRRDFNWLNVMGLLSLTCAELGDNPEQAEVLYELLLPYSERNTVVGAGIATIGPVSAFLGVLAAVLGRWEDAERWIDDAVGRCRSQGIKQTLPRTLYEGARCFARRNAPGDAERVAAMLAEAEALATEVGMPALLGRIRALEEPVGEA
jgi:class 3 adenylate cyclase/tetratricopeptide (TPR) repeat protein